MSSKAGSRTLWKDSCKQPKWHHSFPACRGPLTPCSKHHSAAAATATSPRLAQQRGAPETQPLLLQQCLTLGGELRHKGSGGTAVTGRLHTPTRFEPTSALCLRACFHLQTVCMVSSQGMATRASQVRRQAKKQNVASATSRNVTHHSPTIGQVRHERKQA